ncbi:MAG: GNAT family N-acetyltransferase [Vicinamibacterales bacterium]|nr:GNAT family N-acetyltransferase [Vicinamibacterales bacterium]
MEVGLDLSIRQFTAAWQLMCSRSPSPSFGAGDGVEYVFSGLPVAFFNVAVVTQHGVSADALKSHGRLACEWAAGKGVPWLFVVTHEALEAGVDPTAVLDDCGLAPMMPLTGMLAQRVPPLARIPDSLDLATPQDDAGCAAILDVNGAAYAMDLEAAKVMAGQRSFWEGQFPVLGLVDGKPVCCAAALMVDGHRYVAMVATEPGQQRRGYADAAMRHALEMSAQAHGELPTVLHATEAGRPVYQRMGYTTLATHTIFIEKRFLDGH